MGVRYAAQPAAERKLGLRLSLLLRVGAAQPLFFSRLGAAR